MKRLLIAAATLSALSGSISFAANGPDLIPVEIQGRNLLNQNCAVCHLKPQFGAKTFGPLLNRETLAGDPKAIAEFISIGTQRMPGFRYRLTASQMESIAAYLKTVPAAAAASSQR